MDSNFMMGSMGSVVGEKITRLVEKAIEERITCYCILRIRWSQNARRYNIINANG